MHRTTRSSQNNAVINAAMAFSRQRKHRHDKSELVFHDFPCCLIVVCTEDPCAHGHLPARERGWDWGGVGG